MKKKTALFIAGAAVGVAACYYLLKKSGISVEVTVEKDEPVCENTPAPEAVEQSAEAPETAEADKEQ